MLNIAICDDSPMQTEIIKVLLDKYQSERTNIELHTQSFVSGDKLLSHMNNGYQIDIFLLDILMPEKNGIDCAREIRERDEEVPIIFLTQSTDYALEAFEVDATQYILKPITENKLFHILDKVIISQKLDERRFYSLSVQKQVFNIPYSSIIYIEFVSRALVFHILGGKIITGNTVRVSFDNSVSPLLKDERFIQSHKSFVVNMSHVKSLGCASFTMKNGSQVPIPAHKYSETKDRYVAFLSKYGIT